MTDKDEVYLEITKIFEIDRENKHSNININNKIIC